jgi:hypothetical protein
MTVLGRSHHADAKNSGRILLILLTSEREGKLSNPRARVASERCMEKIYGNLRKPARGRRARAMH